MAPKSFLLACLLAFTVQIFFSPSVSSLASLLSISKESSSMKGLTKLGEGCVNHPEDVSVVVSKGALYTATRDGWVKYFILHNETLVNWKHIDSQSLLGLTTTKDGGVILCDNEKGLLKVTEEGVEAIVPDASYGQLRKYDPKLKETTVLHEGFYFANGIALSKNEDFVVVCESWKFRCRRYWLKGDRAGILDAFIENLPGGPDNINLAPDGSFWIGLIKMNQTGVRAIQKCREKWELLDAYPGLISLLLPMGSDAGARVVKVDGNDGKIIRDFNDPDATYISFVTSATEFDGNLYLASLQSNFIGILPLDGPEPQLATI
ncbi:protein STRICTOSIDINE SYNTHASE-LIKE 4 [Citrus clementina]|uniref:protein STRICTOSIDINE SYNTHASE-LIKE 4 n=1 Tax=Citrus clementina TaxID=85681 RepID=UPI000CED1D36|nr:protein STRICTOSIDINE SYNTHASE-LIKE 4 [Citrus x clementina]